MVFDIYVDPARLLVREKRTVPPPLLFSPMTLLFISFAAF